MVAKSMSSIELFDTPTRASLFDQDSPLQNKNLANYQTPIIKKPIKVNFESFINENDESEEVEDEPKRKRNKSIFNSMIVVSS